MSSDLPPEISPVAVVATDRPFSPLRRQGKANFKSRRQALGTCPGNKQAVKIGAVAKLAVTDPEYISIPVTWLGLVVPDMLIHSIIKHTGNRKRVTGKLDTIE